MTERGGERREEDMRLVHEIIPGFASTKPDKVFDEQLDAFFRFGTFPDVDEGALSEMEPEDKRNTLRRVENVRRLEKNDEGRPFCTELRDAIIQHFAPGGGQRILLEAMKFMLRVHIDDKDRVDSGLPGVSHQLKVAKNVLDVLAMQGPLDRYDGTILASAMWHDIVEDHEKLLLLEGDMLNKLYEKKNEVEVVEKQKDGTEKKVRKMIPVLTVADSPAKKVITLLEYESGVATETEDKETGERRVEVRPNRFIGQILRLVTLDRVELFKTWDGLSHEDAVKAAERLKAKRDEVSPEVYAENEAKKREFYGLYTLDTFTDPRRAGEAASLIKIMDLRDNALTIGRIRGRYKALEGERETERDEELENNISNLRNKYEDLKVKYKGPLVDLYKALPGWPKDTWVGGIRESLHKEIGGVLKEEYGIAIE